MNKPDMSQEELKAALKDALVETLSENKEVFQEILSEVLDDFFRGQVLTESDSGRRLTRSDGFPVVEGRA